MLNCLLMLRRHARFFLLLTLWTVVCPAAARPKLVFLLVIDQFRADYLERFRPDFVPGGFNRLLTRGAVFANTNYDYASTSTAPGHATISTGAIPAAHGIISNRWYDRERKNHVTSVSDSNYKLVGVKSTAPGASPRNLVGSSLADEIRLASGGKSQVVGISLKDRSAILLAGKRPTAVFWFEPTTGRVVTSTYYGDALPAWSEEFNQKYGLANFPGREWRPLAAPPSASPLAIIQRLSPPVAEQQTGVDPDGSPFASESVLELARRAMREYKLGRGPATDFLSVSLSSNDYLGHYAGPDSPLVREMTLRTDRMLAEFFSFLDEQVGPGSFLLAFSADHGVAPLPEVLRERGMEGGRVSSKEVVTAIEEALAKAYGSAASEKWFVYDQALTELPDLYLNPTLLEKYKVGAEEVSHRAGVAALSVPGILAYFTAGQIAHGPISTVLARRVANSYFPGRSGDLLVVSKPFYHWSPSSGRGTSHGSPWSYDTHVPLIFMGSGFRPGVYQTPATPADLAPTVAAVLGINPPAVATGRALAEAFVVPVTEGNRQKAAGFGSKR